MGCSSSKSAAHSGLDTINPFSATGDPHSRCNHMLKEAAPLARVATKYEKDLKAMQDSLTAALESGGVVMSTPLPGVYDDTASVAASAVVGASEPVGGVGFRLESSNAAKGDLSGKLAGDTVKPIKDWLARFNDALTHQKGVDKAYDELEKARKAVSSQKDKIEKVRAKVATDPKASEKVAAEETALQTLANKLSVAETNHTNLEGAQHARVSALNRDAIQFRQAIRNALEAASSALSAAKDTISSAATPAGTPPPAVGGVGVAGR